MSTETTTVSWGERLGSSIKGVIIGIVLFLAGIAVLFWNEGNYVKTKKTLEEGEAACVSLPSIDSVDSTYEGKLVHAKGKAVTQDQLTDTLFNFSQPGIRLVRKAEIYQWVETSSTKTQKNLGGSETKVTTYSYNQKWCNSPVDSGSFHDPGHDNFNFFPEATTNTANSTVYAQNVQFGAFRLNEKQIKEISGETPLKATEITIPEELRGRAVANGNYIYVGRPSNYMQQPGMPMAQPAGYVQQPGMVQPGMPVAQPGVMPAIPVVTDGGYITATTIRAARIAVNNVDGVPFIIDSKGNAALVTANGVMWNGQLHQITATEPGNNMVYNKNDQTSPQYANITNYGSLPVFKVEAKEFVKLPDGSLARLRSQNGAWQLMINGAYYTANITPTPAFPAPAVQPVVQPGMPVVQPGMPMQPGMTSVNPGAPQIGDVRITWTIVKPEQTISLVAVQNGDTFSPYVSKDTGKSFDLLEMGEKTAAEMFTGAHSANSMQTWLIRLGCWFAMYLGAGMVLKPLSVLGDVVPFIGTLIEFGGKLISFVVSTVVALVVIAIAWLFYRPLIAIPLLVGAVALIIWLKSRKKKEEPAPATAGDAPPAPEAEEGADK